MKKVLKLDRENRMIGLATGITYMQVNDWCEISASQLKLSFMRCRHHYWYDPMDEKYPCIVFICGGGFQKVDINAWMPNLVYYAERGYAVASVEYSVRAYTEHPAPIQEIKTAIRFLRAHADELKIDPDRIGVMGESAGGYLSSLVGLTGDDPAYRNGYYPEQSDAVKCVVPWYTPSNLRLMPNPLRVRIDNFPDLNQLVTENTPPFQLWHGLTDEEVPYAQSEMLYETLQAKGVESDLYQIEDAHHADALFQQPAVKEIICKFFDKHLK